jgi:hypothetical protein
VQQLFYYKANKSVLSNVIEKMQIAHHKSKSKNVQDMNVKKSIFVYKRVKKAVKEKCESIVTSVMQK